MVTSAHQVLRPEWVCRTDGYDWPCVAARALLIDVHGVGSVALMTHMTRLLMVAAEDLEPAAPARTYRRFVAWTLPKGTRCRVCGRFRHDVVPGVPLRLVPCDQVRELARERQAQDAAAGCSVVHDGV
jgi:hypothetical protein